MAASDLPTTGGSEAPSQAVETAPLLLVIAGPPGSGKTTLSRTIGDAVGLPVVCRDAIKEGVAFTTGHVVRSGTPEAAALFGLFYELVDDFLARGISLIAEAAFRGDIAPRELALRAATAQLRLIRCAAPPDVCFRRFVERAPRPGHRDRDFAERTRAAGGPDAPTYWLELPGVPTLEVDTTAGYDPTVDTIVDFVRASRC